MDQDPSLLEPHHLRQHISPPNSLARLSDSEISDVDENGLPRALPGLVEPYPYGGANSSSMMGPPSRRYDSLPTLPHGHTGSFDDPIWPPSDHPNYPATSYGGRRHPPPLRSYSQHHLDTSQQQRQHSLAATSRSGRSPWNSTDHRWISTSFATSTPRESLMSNNR